MRTISLILSILALLLGGCTSATLTITPTPNPPAASAAHSGSFFSINEIGLGPEGYVSLTNFTSQPANPGGLYLCQADQCFELPRTDVPAGATVRIAVGSGAGLENVIASGATIGELRPSDGEVAVFSSKDLKDPSSIMVYLEWGSTPHANTEVAIQAGLWLKGSFAPTSEKATRLFRGDGGLWLFDEK